MNILNDKHHMVTIVHFSLLFYFNSIITLPASVLLCGSRVFLRALDGSPS